MYSDDFGGLLNQDSKTGVTCQQTRPRRPQHPRREGSPFRAGQTGIFENSDARGGAGEDNVRGRFRAGRTFARDPRVKPGPCRVPRAHPARIGAGVGHP